MCVCVSLCCIMNSTPELQSHCRMTLLHLMMDGVSRSQRCYFQIMSLINSIRESMHNVWFYLPRYSTHPHLFSFYYFALFFVSVASIDSSSCIPSSIQLKFVIASMWFLSDDSQWKSHKQNCEPIKIKRLRFWNSTRSKYIYIEVIF
jgi:hypothetical protein